MLFIILSAAIVIICVGSVIFISMQEPKDAGLGSITGNNGELFANKYRKKTRDEKLAKITAILVTGFFIVAILLNCGFVQ